MRKIQYNDLIKLTKTCTNFIFISNVQTQIVLETKKHIHQRESEESRTHLHTHTRELLHTE